MHKFIPAPQFVESKDKQFNVGSSCMKNWGITTNDDQMYILNLKDNLQAALFGLYNGHGGNTIVKYTAKHLHNIIVERPEYLENNIEQALIQGYLEIDRMMQNIENDDKTLARTDKKLVGSTALVVLIKDNKLYCANVGNSFAIASVKGELVVLSVEHRTTDNNPRVVRTLGNYLLKFMDNRPMEYIFTSYPNLETLAIDEEWEFIVMGCNRIRYFMSELELLQLCRERIGRGIQLDDICREVLITCFAPNHKFKHLTNNLNCILVCLLHNKSYSDLIQHCANAGSSF